MTKQELKSFNQGFLYAVACAYESCYLDANSALEFLRYVGGFKTLDECLAYEPNEDEAETLKALFEMQQTLFDEKRDYHHENKGKLQKI